MDEKALQLLIDERAIEQTIYRYYERIDANDPPGAVACFMEDAVGKWPWGEFRGRKAISEMVTKILNTFSTTSHHLSNISISRQDNTATLFSYVYTFHRMVDSGEPMHFWGRIIIRSVKTKEGWLFAEYEAIGVGSIEPDGADRKRNWPGHPGRLTR